MMAIVAAVLDRTCQQRSPAQGVQYTENGRCHWYVEASMQKRTCRRGRQWRITEVADRVIYPVQNHQRQYGFVICWKWTGPTHMCLYCLYYYQSYYSWEIRLHNWLCLCVSYIDGTWASVEFWVCSSWQL